MRGGLGFGWRVVAAGVGAVALVPVLVSPVSAHAELAGASPSAGAQLESAPREVTLVFDAEVTEDSWFTVADESGGVAGTGELDLNVAARNVLRGEVTATRPGAYTVSWVAIDAIDGDTTRGELTFHVLVETASTTASARPDTAMADTGVTRRDGAVTLTGLVLLAAAAATAIAAGRGVRWGLGR